MSNYMKPKKALVDKNGQTWATLYMYLYVILN